MKNYIKQTTVYILHFTLCILLMTSCSDFLDTESPSQQTAEVVFENEGMAKSAIMGIYAQLPVSFVYGQKMSVNWQGVSDIELASGYAKDDAYNSKESDTGAANYWCDWYNKTVRWDQVFKLAELAAAAVDGIRKSDLLKSDPGTMQPYLGEALALRALAYFELVRRWGDVPYKEGMSNSDLSNVYLAKTDRDIVYAAIVKDMQEAIEYLPWLGESVNSSTYNCERITKGFAKGLLARIALFAGGWSVRNGKQFSDENVEHYPNTESNSGMAELNSYYVGRTKDWKNYYEIAEQQCAELIADPNNPHSLDPDYGDIWKSVCGLRYNAFNENLFEVANGEGQSGDIGTLMGRVTQSGIFGGNYSGYGGQYVSTNGYYFYSFSPGDLRRDYACYWPEYQKDETNGNIDREVMKADIMALKLGKWSWFWTSDSYKALAKTATSRVPTGINWILMRYPDVLLMFAEARYALTNDADGLNPVAQISARQALEKVRERAFGGAAVSSYDPDFFKAIVNERAWEFGGEGIRKLDLVRWGLLDQKIDEMKEAMLRMFDGTQAVKIFDKEYQPENFPDTIYYKYDGKFIDYSSCNFYEKLDANPDAGTYSKIAWFPSQYWNQEEGSSRVTTLIDNSYRILLCATGLKASYNYDNLLSKLQYGSQIKEKFITKKTGNGVCNYRHLYSIYYEDVYESNGFLTNSYGFDYQ